MTKKKNGCPKCQSWHLRVRGVWTRVDNDLQGGDNLQRPRMEPGVISNRTYVQDMSLAQK